MVIKTRIEPLLTALNEIMSGLTCYNMIHVIQENSDLFHAVLCPSEMFLWNHGSFLEILKPQLSDEGNNKRSLKVTTYKSFLDFVEACCFNSKKIFFITSHFLYIVLALQFENKYIFIK